nr:MULTISPECIES: hypothetical protein [unclassified Enterococcus]
MYRTVEANELDSVKYLEFLFDRIPNIKSLTDEALDEFCLGRLLYKKRVPSYT